MKKLVIFGVLLSLFSCKKEAKVTSLENKKDSAKTAPAKVVAPEFHKELYGIWTGSFYPDYKRNPDDESGETKKISIKIDRITADTVWAQSIVSGNQRPLIGKTSDQGNKISFILDEPGNRKDDGRFELFTRNDSLIGKWTAYNTTGVKSPYKKLDLAQKQFVYNPNFMLSKDAEFIDWTTPKEKKETYKDDDGKIQTYTQQVYRSASDDVYKINSSTQKLTEKQLKNLRKLDLEILRNTIFARHGYSFKKQTYRNFFEYTDWYVPVSNNVDKELTPLEKENAQLLSRMEKYAKDTYNSYGR
ncbi:YARHG domain-containing protein [Elizabethkingia anophelis]|uniref:Serine/threonine protein kinase n=1 Tax=Elizabethkingia anophelis TaxID=1117645 RepID=A0A1T3DN60_9FLAO|nr:YARHG domain-containing protein [Elizabethkingia anophelis]AMR42146.1 serine/threonine protein kinase [Elizabethkingia anophelis]AMX48786.1 serine/threonine protein kinase [Elizabethkingia anophelis]AMX52244.1 serine/threonine protein kinase [Elizabethkingia anophelis]AMX55633.1 serine/threonine protein kinase [Elizabethkingia anophelis]AQW97623.1 serine/threonine protein kinase [Elizabethkingia anophelis]